MRFPETLHKPSPPCDEKLWVTHPDHPGLPHYIIHAYDYPAIADKGLSAALQCHVRRRRSRSSGRYRVQIMPVFYCGLGEPVHNFLQSFRL